MNQGGGAIKKKGEKYKENKRKRGKKEQGDISWLVKGEGEGGGERRGAEG